MEIKTKFNIGDWVYCIVHDRIQQLQIVSITIDIDDNATDSGISYRVKVPVWNKLHTLSESNCFENLEELFDEYKDIEKKNN